MIVSLVCHTPFIVSPFVVMTAGSALSWVALAMPHSARADSPPDWGASRGTGDAPPPDADGFTASVGLAYAFRSGSRSSEDGDVSWSVHEARLTLGLQPNAAWSLRLEMPIVYPRLRSDAHDVILHNQTPLPGDAEIHVGRTIRASPRTRFRLGALAIVPSGASTMAAPEGSLLTGAGLFWAGPLAEVSGHPARFSWSLRVEALSGPSRIVSYVETMHADTLSGDGRLFPGVQGRIQSLLRVPLGHRFRQGIALSATARSAVRVGATEERFFPIRALDPVPESRTWTLSAIGATHIRFGRNREMILQYGYQFVGESADMFSVLGIESLGPWSGFLGGLSLEAHY